MNRTLLLALAVFVFSCTWAVAQDDPDPGLKASTLRDACHPPASANQAAREAGDLLCQTYLRGFADGLFLHATLQQSGSRICLPQDGPVSPAEAKEELDDYLTVHPEAAEHSASIAAAFAIVAAHPCE